MSNFIDELKRRKVFRAGIAYLLVAWVMMQIADVLSPILELPDWAARLVFFLLAIGFVPALLLAWAYELTPEGVKRESAGSSEIDSPRAAGSNISRLLIGIPTVALIAIAIFWFAGKDARWARDIAFPQIEAHADADEYEEAYALAKLVQAKLPDDPDLAGLWGSFAWVASIPSDPPGVTVSRRAYSENEAEWEDLGETPLHDIHIPFGASLIRLEKDGHQSLLRVLGGFPLGSTFMSTSAHAGDTAYLVSPERYVLPPRGNVPEGMVGVPGQSLILEGDLIDVDDFLIGRYEVTNQEFKAFVDAGAYRRRDLWEHEFTDGGEVISWEQAMELFTDRTGRPGPASWEAGGYLDGEDNHPVSGVSWYEAAAYARFAGAELPTVHHWRRAFAASTLAWQIPASNLADSGAAPVGQYQGIGWTGTFDMLGNVREWCQNASDDQRVIVGGGWDDAPYMAEVTISNPGAMPPLDRSVTNGFRLASMHEEREVAQRLRKPVTEPEQVRYNKPISDEVFAAYLRDYDYDSGAFNAVVEEMTELRHGTRERISFDAGDGTDKIILYLFLPNAGLSRYQTVLFWPGSTAFYLDSIDQARIQLDFILRNGRAVAFPLPKGTYERGVPGVPDWSTVAGRDLTIRQVRDMRRTIDYLETRPDIKYDALAYYGHSWGGRVGAIALAVERRLKVGIFDQAGINFLVHHDIDVVHFLSRVSQPVLQFNGRYDTDFRYETSAKPFFDLIGSNEKKHVVEPTGHFVPQAIVIGETLNWLDRYLGPVDSRAMSRVSPDDR